MRTSPMRMGLWIAAVAALIDAADASKQKGGQEIRAADLRQEPCR